MLTENFWEDWDDYMGNDKPWWQVGLSAAGKNRRVQELAAIVLPEPDPKSPNFYLEITLVQMQQAILSLDTTQQAQHDQIEVLVTYIKHTRKENKHLKKELNDIHTKLRALDSGK